MPAIDAAKRADKRLQTLTEARAHLAPLGAEYVKSGLSAEQVHERVKLDLSNELKHDSSRSFWQILRANLFTLFNAVLTLCFVVVLLVGDWKDGFFYAIVLANILIGVVQEYRAKRTLDKLAVLSAPTARVMREGSWRDLALDDVVLDDLIEIRTGDQVPADALVLESRSVVLDESLLTGESDGIAKGSGDEIFSGSAVLEGSATARVNKVGPESFSARLTAEAKRFSLVNSEIRNALNKMVLWVTWALLPIILVVVNGQMQAQGGWGAAWDSGAWRVAVIKTVASVVGMIPEGLVLLASVSFGLAAITLGRRKVLVQELPAVEGLARVDMVCLDKTGTLTEGRIKFDTEEPLVNPPVDTASVLAWFGAQGSSLTGDALGERFGASSLSAAGQVPFSSARKWSSASFDSATGADAGTWVFGAPEMVLASGSAPLARAAELAAEGARTLVLAHSTSPMVEHDGEWQLPADLTPVSLLTFSERVRPDAAETLQYFREQGVDLMVISGDNPATVAAIAHRVGIGVSSGSAGAPEAGFDARNLPEGRAELDTVLAEHRVFGRVTPDQKFDMVSALQASGRVVAMTGDGVNDALALKKAEIGVAMGSGAPATKAVSRLVLLDGKFSRLPGVVAEGRRVIANIERVSNLFLTKTAYAIFSSLLFGIFLLEYPFLPRQLSLVSSLTIGLPSLVLALLPNKRRYLPGFLGRALKFSVPAGLVITAVIFGTYWLVNEWLGASREVMQTACTISLTAVAMWVLVVLCRPFDRIKTVLVAVLVLVFVAMLTVPLFANFFAFVIPDGAILATTLGVAVLGCGGIEILFRLVRKDALRSQ